MSDVHASTTGVMLDHDQNSTAPSGTSRDALPFVSVVVACRNEAEFIGGCIESILGNDYPQARLEVLIVDGRSTDATRPIVEKYAQEHPCVRLIDNPGRITPLAFNLGVTNSCGDLVVIMGAHSSYKSNYISKCVEYSIRHGADNVGGIVDTLPRNPTLLGHAIAAALGHRFGAGNSYFRSWNGEPRWVDTVFGGCYRRNVFDRIGLFNESLKYSQDIEFNRRLRSAGGRTLLVPEIVSQYYARSDLRSFWRHNINNGKWSILPFAFTTIMPVGLRHLVPLMFVLSLLVTSVAGIWFHTAWWLLAMIVGSYLSLNLASSIQIARRKRRPAFACVLPLVFASLHIGYGIGSLLGVVKLITLPKFWRRVF